MEIEKFNNVLLDWFNRNKRDLLFRKDHDPYKIWVSEVMSQQTKIETLLPYFERFIKAFPTVNDLAKANEEDVLTLWEGLGYYSRAKNLLKASQILEKERFPGTYNELIKLPGIGDYTAGAIASIAFNQKVPSLDGNTARVISRIYAIKDKVTLSSTKKKIKETINEHLKSLNKPGDFNQAIMDIGSKICLKKSPKCSRCPVNNFCLARKNNLISIIPNTESKKKNKEVFNDVVIPYYNDQPAFLLRDLDSLLKGMNGFPMMNNNGKIGSKIQEIGDSYSIRNISYKKQSIHIFSGTTWISSVFTGDLEELQNDFTLNPVLIPTAFKKMLC